MKNQLINYFNLKTIFFLGLFLISSCFVNAQISVNSNGAVKLVGDLNISTSGTSSQILPDESNAALIGDPMKYFIKFGVTILKDITHTPYGLIFLVQINV